MLLHFRLLFANRLVLLILLSLLSSLVGGDVWGQEVVELKLQDRERETAGKFLGRDIFDATYWQRGAVLIKKQDNKVLNFQDKSLGNFKIIDLSIPNRTGVYFDNANTWVVLDRFLVPQYTYDLNVDLLRFRILYMASSTQNKYWVVDGQTKSIYRYDPIQHKIGKLYRVIEKDVNRFYSTINYLYWISPEKMLRGVDVYGNEVVDVLVPAYDQIQVLSPEKCLYLYENKLYVFDVQSRKSIRIPIQNTRVTDFYYDAQKLSIFDYNNLTTYHLKIE